MEVVSIQKKLLSSSEMTDCCVVGLGDTQVAGGGRVEGEVDRRAGEKTTMIRLVF